MKLSCRLSTLLLPLIAASLAFTDDKKSDEPKKDDNGFVPMFNGKDLSGWVNVNCAPDTFYVKDKEIITTGKPTGYLRTEKQYENFIAEFEWKHIPNKPGEVGNSGFFVWCDPLPAAGTGYTRGIEVQVLVNLTYKNKKGEITATSQGDLFSIHGAKCVPDRPHPDGWDRCLPSADHCKGEGEWNHYRVEAADGVIKLAVNGHFVSGVGQCNPRKGYLALESEGSECHFRNLKIMELPTTNPKKEEIADLATGFKNLYTGLDLSGWKMDEKAKEHWQPKDFVLHHDGEIERGSSALRTDQQFTDAEIIIDFRFPLKDGKPCEFSVGQGYDFKGSGSTSGSPKPDKWRTLSLTPAGEWSFDSVQSKDNAPLKPAGQWNRLHGFLRITNEDKAEFKVNGKVFATDRWGISAGKFVLILQPKGEMDFANVFVRELK